MSEQVWSGALALEDDLIPLDSISAHPDNPRRGNIDLIMRSLSTYGQKRAILVQASTRWVVAGNHTRLAAEQLGWTHIAAVVDEMDEETTRAYLAIDNRTSDVATYDAQKLHTLLAPFERVGKLDVTGYTLEAFKRLHEAVDSDKVAKPEAHLSPTQETKEALTAVLPREKMADLRRWLQMLKREWGIDDPSDVIHEAIKREAAGL